MNEARSREERPCPFCESTRVAGSIEARERMFGLDGTFVYRRCAECGSLYLEDTQIDLARFYPSGYYSYGQNRRSPLLYAVDRLQAQMQARSYLAFLRKTNARIDHQTRFLDIGCGDGLLLRALRDVGFAKGIGIDPYLNAEAETRGVTILRRSLADVVRECSHLATADVVMFHHSLEHVVNPAEYLHFAELLLARGGVILVRIPLVNYAWDRYRTNWVGLDAPRHLAIPTLDGLKQLADRLNLDVTRIEFDSTAVQFVASEALERGNTLTSAFPSNPPRTALRAIRSIGKSLRAKQLNARGRGDQARFALVRRTDRKSIAEAIHHVSSDAHRPSVI